MLCDLHIHSNYSTGNQSLEDIMEEALSKEISLISITDDDTTAAYQKLPDITQKYKVSYIKGVQVSAINKGHLFRLLVYDYDLKNIEFQELLKHNRAVWDDIGGQTIDILKNEYPDLSKEEYFNYQRNPKFGGFKYNNYMYYKGIDGSDTASVKIFKKYRNEMISVIENSEFRRLEEVLAIIHAANGRAILPGGYLRNVETLEEDLQNLVDLGIDGFEYSSPSYDKKTENMVRDFAKSHKMLITGGGDGHGTWADTNKYAIGISKIAISDLALGDIKIYDSQLNF